MVKKLNLRIDTGVKRDMLGYDPAIGRQIYDFIKLLADNPNTVAIIPKPVEFSKDHFYHRLPGGCLVFWELIHAVPRRGLSITRQDGEVVRVTGVGFEFPKGFKEFSL